MYKVYKTAQERDCQKQASELQRDPCRDPGFQPEQEGMLAILVFTFLQRRPGPVLVLPKHIVFRRGKIAFEFPVGGLAAQPRQACVEN